ncbi:MAG: NAD(P)H-hydrate dehydratase [Pseudomonadales bacterium]|nr:NAD(P)H-hydrate dehydratase [Pseudomonadales bacterium]
MTSLPTLLYTASQVQAMDRHIIDSGAVTGYELMNRAGRATFRVLLRHWPETRNIIVFCGGGNNGGDGYIIAGLARCKGISATVLALVNPDKLHGDALQAYHWAIETGVTVQTQALVDAPGISAAFSAVCAGEFSNGGARREATVIVDAMLGTGATGPLRAPFDSAVRVINQSACPVVSVDIPTGVSADSGVVSHLAVHAHVTVTYIAMKQGLLTGAAPNYTGKLYFDDLAVSPQTLANFRPASKRAALESWIAALPVRRVADHKGRFGRIIVVGGDLGMGGAAILASEAGARSGAGLISVATRSAHLTAVLSRRPEIMAKGVESGEELVHWLEEKLDQGQFTLVVGPGLGQGDWGTAIFNAVQTFLKSCYEKGIDLPSVWDADALNLISRSAQTEQGWMQRAVATPHPGEAARLLQCSVSDIEADRFAAVQKLNSRLACTVVLKGAGTLVSAPSCGAEGKHEDIWLANTGNPGMASGGMGDVLNGIIGALLAQGMSPLEAAVLGVLVHGESADLAIRERGIVSLLAGDVVDAIGSALSRHASEIASVSP